MKVVAYLTHPVGPKGGYDIYHRGDNIANAIEWMVWLVDNSNWAICASWLTNLQAMDDEMHRPRLLADQLALMVRCDILVLCGGLVSPHMRVEAEMARLRGKVMLDLTLIGRHPPVKHSRPPSGRSWMAWLEDQVGIISKLVPI